MVSTAADTHCVKPSSSYSPPPCPSTPPALPLSRSPPLALSHLPHVACARTVRFPVHEGGQHICNQLHVAPQPSSACTMPQQSRAREFFLFRHALSSAAGGRGRGERGNFSEGRPASVEQRYGTPAPLTSQASSWTQLYSSTCDPRCETNPVPQPRAPPFSTESCLGCARVNHIFGA